MHGLQFVKSSLLLNKSYFNNLISNAILIILFLLTGKDLKKGKMSGYQRDIEQAFMSSIVQAELKQGLREGNQLSTVRHLASTFRLNVRMMLIITLLFCIICLPFDNILRHLRCFDRLLNYRLCIDTALKISC